MRVDISKIAEHIIRSLIERDLSDSAAIAADYAKRSIMAGKRIFVREGRLEYFAEAISVGEDLSLRVMTDSGEMRELSSADVAIRM